MTVRLVVRTAGKVGVNRFTCRWGDDRDRPWAAGVRVELCQPEQFDPPGLSFGVVGFGRPLTGTVRYRQHAARVEDLPPAPTFRPDTPPFVPAGQGVVVTPGPATVTRVGDGLVRREIPLTVSIPEPKRVGADNGRVFAVGPGGLTVTTNFLLVEWTAKPAVEVSPPRVVFTGPSAGPQRVLFRADGGPEFRVTRASSSHPGVRAAVLAELGEDGGRVVEITVLPDRVKRTTRGEIEVATTHPQAATLSVPFTILVLPSDPAGGPSAPAK